MTTTEILGKVASGDIKADEAAKLIEAINGGSNKPTELTYKVSAKGALSCYGSNARFPVTLYAGQWERLDSDDERKRRADFIKANAKELARK